MPCRDAGDLISLEHHGLQNHTGVIKYSETWLKAATQNEDQKLVFKTDFRLMQVKSFAEGSSLQYFRPSLSNHLSLRPLFCIFLNGRLRQAVGSNYF